MFSKHSIQKVLNRVGYTIRRTKSIDKILDANHTLIRERDAEKHVLFQEREQLAAKLLLLQKEIAYRRKVSVAIVRYFTKRLRTPDVALPFEEVRVDSSVEWVPQMLERGELTEPEFSIFRFFKDPTETILDIGANCGYATASIWASGSRASILSFEPNPWHFSCLQAIKDSRRGLFDFLGVGLGSIADTVCFTMPVIEGVGLSALCSARIESELEWIPEMLVSHALKHLPHLAQPRFQFAEVAWPVIPLDDALKRDRFAVPLEKIAAIKLDTEGFETEVICGGTGTLSKHRPLILVEGANRVETVVNILSDLGYAYGDWQNDRVVLTGKQSRRVGGFFLHRSRLAEYRDKGLLIEG